MEHGRITGRRCIADLGQNGMDTFATTRTMSIAQVSRSHFLVLYHSLATLLSLYFIDGMTVKLYACICMNILLIRTQCSPMLCYTYLRKPNTNGVRPGCKPYHI